MSNDVRVLVFSRHALEQLAARGFRRSDARAVLRNRRVVTRNPNATHPAGRLLIGRTDGGVALTLAIYPPPGEAPDPGLWVVATAWTSTPREVRALERGSRG